MISDPDLAAKIVALMFATSNRLNESLAAVQEHCPDAEFQQYRSAVGKIMGEMLTEVLNPVWGEYPELMRREMRPGDTPRVRLEFHDSTLSKIEPHEGWLNLYFEPAYVQVWAHEDGDWRGRGWSRDVRLAIAGGVISSGASATLPAHVSGGCLSLGAAKHGGVVPLPFGESGAVELNLTLEDGALMAFRGGGVSVAATSHGSVVETLPGDSVPDEDPV